MTNTYDQKLKIKFSNLPEVWNNCKISITLKRIIPDKLQYPFPQLSRVWFVLDEVDKDEKRSGWSRRATTAKKTTSSSADRSWRQSSHVLFSNWCDETLSGFKKHRPNAALFNHKKLLKISVPSPPPPTNFSRLAMALYLQFTLKYVILLSCRTAATIGDFLTYLFVT